MCLGLNPNQLPAVRAREFPNWFTATVTSNEYICSPSLKSLATWPSPHIKVYNGYVVNGFRFHIEQPGRKGRSNSGVCVRGVSGADADPSNYYGKLQRIIELDYNGYTVFVFMCNWFDTFNPTGIWSKPEFGWVELNPDRQLRVYEPFIIATQASQVYYAKSAGNHLRPVQGGRRGWISVISTRARHVIEGFTITPQAPSDDEDDNQPPTAEYQDDRAPRITYPTHPPVDEDIPLATTDVVRVHDEDEPEEDEPEEVPEDNGIEHFSSDEYPDV